MILAALSAVACTAPTSDVPPDGNASGGDPGTGAPAGSSSSSPAPTGTPSSPGSPDGPDAAPSDGDASTAPASGGLHVAGNELRDASGARIVLKGANIEFLRYVDPCTTSIASFEHTNRVAFAQALHGYGVNAVRINIGTRAFAANPPYVTMLGELVTALHQAGIYSMISDHDYTGTDLSGHAASFATFSAIIAAARQHGDEAYLLVDPYNEPGPMAWDAWRAAMVDTIDHLRTVDAFKGVVVLDTVGWATGFDAPTFDAVLAHDANVAFSNHWYPNIPMAHATSVMANAAHYPLLVGEIGQINPGSSPLDPGYVADLLDHVVQTDVPNGHNGVFPWQWKWCDENSMSDDYYTLGGYAGFGTLVDDHFYAKPL